ncbi:hypothetical protein [Candidatus Lokiarchaeum ossiferum]|uniref:hypothetical protein n=1 Tax=Candidatus Lokiarchaeum ossiferum TaxID=2951803 RepID=UPI00352DDD15
MSQNQIIDKASLQKILQISDQIRGNLSDLDLNMELYENLPESLKNVKTKLSTLFSRLDSIFSPIKNVIFEDYQSQIINDIQNQANPLQTQKIGLYFIGNQILEKSIGTAHLVSSISPDYWTKIKQILFTTDKFLPILSNLQNFYLQLLDTKIDLELSKVPMEIDDGVREEYRKIYYKQQISFADFLELNKPKKFDSSTQEESESSEKSEQLRQDFEKAIEHKKLEQKKAQQKKSFDNYQEYFKMSERDLERAKRKSTSKRKYTKKSRRGKY